MLFLFYFNLIYMFFWQAEVKQANKESSIDDGENLYDEVNDNNTTVVVSSDNENMSDNVNENVNGNENVDENVNNKVNDVYRELCFRIMSVYATEKYLKKDCWYHRDQAYKLVKFLLF